MRSIFDTLLREQFLDHDEIATSSNVSVGGGLSFVLDWEHRGLGFGTLEEASCTYRYNSTMASALKLLVGASLPNRSSAAYPRPSPTRSGRSTDDPHPANRTRSHDGARARNDAERPRPGCRRRGAGLRHANSGRPEVLARRSPEEPHGRGRPLISTICPYSNYYNDLIRDMSADFAKKGVAFVGVNSGTLETAEEARVHAREHGHTFDIIKDPETRIAELLDARRTPEAYLLDSSGTLRYRGRIASKISAPDLQSAIEALLEGRPVRPAKTKAFGCAIARR